MSIMLARNPSRMLISFVVDYRTSHKNRTCPHSLQGLMPPTALPIPNQPTATITPSSPSLNFLAWVRYSHQQNPSCLTPFPTSLPLQLQPPKCLLRLTSLIYKVGRPIRRSRAHTSRLEAQNKAIEPNPTHRHRTGARTNDRTTSL